MVFASFCFDFVQRHRRRGIAFLAFVVVALVGANVLKQFFRNLFWNAVNLKRKLFF